jgi:hypothetical protein
MQEFSKYISDITTIGGIREITKTKLHTMQVAANQPNVAMGINGERPVAKKAMDVVKEVLNTVDMVWR